MANDTISVAAIAMQDHLGIVYLVENAQQFWSELEDVLKLPSDNAPTLSLLDSTLRRFLALCAAYHEQYLQSPLQLEHACDLILDSELFAFHSERMCEILVGDAQSNTDPHSQLMFYHLLLCHGLRRSDFFRSQKRWQPLTPLLMDHILVEIDMDVEDTYIGMAPSALRAAGDAETVPIPIEAKLRSLSVRILYEICRVQKLSVQDLRIFSDSFLDYLFDLVEQTRYMHDETFNYSVIKLIVALNEQFMVASLSPDAALLNSQENPAPPSESKNRVLRVLMRRLGSSKTFGENMIFMLNRAQRTPDDLCMQLLILKILYLLFTTKGTSEYFYTNDLCVLVDVFLRELVDIDEDSESLRHTYLRVLHPLLTKTQLRDVPYKRPQLVYGLESLICNERIRDINPTTKRLVERCLGGDWCVPFKKEDKSVDRMSPTSDVSTAQSYVGLPASTHLDIPASAKMRSLKTSKSLEQIKDHVEPPRRSAVDARRPSNSSAHSLSGVATATAPNSLPLHHFKRKGYAHSANGDIPHHRDTKNEAHDAQPVSDTHLPLPTGNGLLSASAFSSQTDLLAPITVQATQRRSAPPPPKRRKPPAIPVGRTNGGATITAIKSSATSPLSRVTMTS